MTENTQKSQYSRSYVLYYMVHDVFCGYQIQKRLKGEIKNHFNGLHNNCPVFSQNATKPMLLSNLHYIKQEQIRRWGSMRKRKGEQKGSLHGGCRFSIEKTFTASRTAKTWDPVITIPFPFEFVVISQFLIWNVVSESSDTLVEASSRDSPRSMSLRAYITIRLLPSTLIILAVQLGVQL